MEVPESHRLNGRNEDRVTQMEEFQKKFHSFLAEVRRKKILISQNLEIAETLRVVFTESIIKKCNANQLNELCGCAL